MSDKLIALLREAAGVIETIDADSHNLPSVAAARLVQRQIEAAVREHYAAPPAPAAQPSAEPMRRLRIAARDALVAMIDGLTPVEDGRPHHMVMEYKRALDALRRALDAGDGAGEARKP